MINACEKRFSELEKAAIVSATVSDACINDLKSSGFNVESYFMGNQEDTVNLLEEN
jgi:hypothetical protein